MSHITHHIARRALDVAGTVYTSSKNDQEEHSLIIAPWAISTLICGAIFYLVMMGLVTYTYLQVVARLAMVESPTAAVVTVTQEFEVDEKNKEELESTRLLATDTEVTVLAQKPITSSLRGSVQHLRAVGGPGARLRGLSAAAVVTVLKYFMFDFLYAVLPFRLIIVRSALATLITSILVVRFSTLWTHMIIAMPSSAPWCSRIPTWKAASATIRPTIVLEAVRGFSAAIPFYVAFIGINMITASNEAEGQSAEQILDLQRNGTALLVSAFMLAPALYLLLVIPAKVTLHRIQASLLPDTEETIVPMDRTFGGLIKPAILGGSGTLGMLDAWKTFDRPARLRLLKIYLKTFFIHVFLLANLGIFVCTVMYAGMGEQELNHFIAFVKKQVLDN